MKLKLHKIITRVDGKKFIVFFTEFLTLVFTIRKIVFQLCAQWL